MMKNAVMISLALSCSLFMTGCSKGTGAKLEKRTELSAPIYDGVERSSFYVPVRDGTKLAMNIYWPTHAGLKPDQKLPVIFVATPYRARYRKKDGKLSEIALSPRLGLSQLSKRGFVIAVADIRGKGASFGARRGFQDRTEAMDGYDLVEWLAERPWSNGNVGMVGCSYLGGAAMQVASTTPPHLKAVFAGASDFDKFAFVKRGGISAQFNTRPDEPAAIDLASIPVDADGDGSDLKRAVAQHEKNTSMAGLWRSMPFRDDVSDLTQNRFWDEVAIYHYADKIKDSDIALYHWGNWEDEPTAQTIMMAKNLGGKLLVGPGSHCVPPKGMDFGAELGKFFDHYLNDIATGIEQEPRSRYWMNGAPAGQEWKFSDQIVGENGQTISYQLSKDRLVEGIELLGTQQASTQSFMVDYSLNTGSYFNFWVDSMADHGISYQTEPLSSDLHILGYPMADLSVSVSRGDAPVKDANVFVYLEEVMPDDKARVISFGRLAASHRKTSIAPYDTLGLPWHSGRRADMSEVKIGEIMPMQIEMTPSGEIIKSGNRLRFVVTGADPRQRNLEQIKQNPAPRITVHNGGNHGSVLRLKIQKDSKKN